MRKTVYALAASTLALVGCADQEPGHVVHENPMVSYQQFLADQQVRNLLNRANEVTRDTEQPNDFLGKERLRTLVAAEANLREDVRNTKNAALLALSYADLGNFEVARGILKFYSEKFPSDPDIMRALFEIDQIETRPQTIPTGEFI